MFKYLSKSELIFAVYVLMKDLRNDYSILFWERFNLLEKFLIKLENIDEKYIELYEDVIYWKKVFDENDYVSGKDIDYSLVLEKIGAINEIDINEIRTEFVIYLFSYLISPPSSIIPYFKKFENFKFLKEEV